MGRADIDIATLGIKIETQGTQKAASELDKLDKAGKKAGTTLQRDLPAASRKVGADLRRLGSDFLAAAKPIAAFAGVAAAAGAAISLKWTRDVIRAGGELQNFSRIAGSSAQEFQRWSVGAATVGIGTEKLADQLKDFNEKVGEFQQTGGGGMRDFFEQVAPKIGITAAAFRDLSGPQALQLYFDSLEKANLSQQQLSFYLESMASDTTALIPLLRNGGQGFRRWADEAERFGSIMSDDLLRSIDETRKASVRLDQAFDGMKIRVASELLPAMNQLADLLGEQNTQRALRGVAEMLGLAASKAVEFGRRMTEAGEAYRKWLADAGRLPANMLDNEEQIKERIRKLSRIVYGNDPVNRVRMAVFGDDFRAQLQEAVKELNGFRWRNVISGASSMPVGGAQPTGGGNPLGGGGGRDRQMPDFAKDAAAELREMLEAMADARGEFDAWAAQLAGPIANANYQFAIDMERLNELARTGEAAADELATAQANLRREHEANLEAINRQINPQLDLIDSLQDEVKWLQATTAEQYRLTAARMAGNTATEAQVGAIADLLRNRDQLIEAQRNWHQFGGTVSDALYDVVTGATSAKDALRNFFDSIAAQITRNITDSWGDRIAGMFKGMGSGSSGGGWAQLLGALFGGARASGGPAQYGKAYLVGEKGPELFVPGQSGYVSSAEQTRRLGRGVIAQATGGGASAGPVSVQQTFVIQGALDKSTQGQLARQNGREVQKAMGKV